MPHFIAWLIRSTSTGEAEHAVEHVSAHFGTAVIPRDPMRNMSRDGESPPLVTLLTWGLACTWSMGMDLPRHCPVLHPQVHLHPSGMPPRQKKKKERGKEGEN